MAHKTFRRVALGASALLPVTLMAAEPAGITFGASWNLDTATNTINYTCPAGYTCSAPVTQDNFYQVELDDGNGNLYFQTIIATGNGAGEDFSTESFVSRAPSGFGGGGGGQQGAQAIPTDGIASYQSIGSATNGSMTATSEISTGIFNNGDPNVTLTQATADTTGEFTSGFNLSRGATADRDGDGIDETYTNMSLSQANTAADAVGTYAQNGYKVDLSAGGTQVDQRTIDITNGVVLNTGGTTNDQSFTYALREGSVVAEAGSASFADGQSISWAVGDKVERVLVNQTVTDAGNFGFERLANLTDPAAPQTASTSAVGQLGPFASFTPTTANPF